MCVFGSHTFVQTSWMCKKQTSVLHSSPEAEIMSLDTGLRLDGLLALELWDLIVSVLGNVSRVSDRSGKPESKRPIRESRSFVVCVCEDNEAVIKMIIIGRSPTMRHVSRTRRVIESSSSISYSKWDGNNAWSSQEWKTFSEMYERSERPDETSWRTTRGIRSGFSHEETHHDGTAQPVVNEVVPRDRPGRPDIDSQGAWPQQFVIGNDEAELELSVESRSFVNRGE